MIETFEEMSRLPGFYVTNLDLVALDRLSVIDELGTCNNSCYGTCSRTNCGTTVVTRFR